MQALLTDVRTVALDLPGHGAAPDLDDHHVAAQADAVRRQIEQLSLGEYVLVGHSMGGKIALHLAADRPAGLVGLALVAPSPPTPEPIPAADRQALIDGHGDPTQAERTARTIVAHPLPPTEHDAVVADNLRTTRNSWDGWLTVGSQENLVADVARLAVPTLVVFGLADRAIAPAIHRRETVARLDQPTVVELPDVGHLVPLEAPAALATALRLFLATLPS